MWLPCASLEIIRSPSHTHTQFPVDVWQQVASPVWMDIRQNNTLNRKGAREEEDEKHICPLQLDLIERCIKLWTNPGDIVLDPFAGIGSVPYQAVLLHRRGLGVELKSSYYQQAVLNLRNAAVDKAYVTDYDVMKTWSTSVEHPTLKVVPECEGQISIFDIA